MRRPLRLAAVVVVGLWVPGLVFSCFAGGRREPLFEVEGGVLPFRGVVEEEIPGLEDLAEGLLPLTEGLMAIAEDAGSSQGCL